MKKKAHLTKNLNFKINWRFRSCLDAWLIKVGNKDLKRPKWNHDESSQVCKNDLVRRKKISDRHLCCFKYTERWQWLPIYPPKVSSWKQVPVKPLFNRLRSFRVLLQHALPCIHLSSLTVPNINSNNLVMVVCHL